MHITFRSLATAISSLLNMTAATQTSSIPLSTQNRGDNILTKLYTCRFPYGKPPKSLVSTTMVNSTLQFHVIRFLSNCRRSTSFAGTFISRFSNFSHSQHFSQTFERLNGQPFSDHHEVRAALATYADKQIDFTLFHLACTPDKCASPVHGLTCTKTKQGYAYANRKEQNKKRQGERVLVTHPSYKRLGHLKHVDGNGLVAVLIDNQPLPRTFHPRHVLSLYEIYFTLRTKRLPSHALPEPHLHHTKESNCQESTEVICSISQ